MTIKNMSAHVLTLLQQQELVILFLAPFPGGKLAADPKSRAQGV